MKLSPQTGGYTLIEMMFTTLLIGVVGLVMYSLLNISTILGAKNVAVNTAHQQARVAMIDMLQDLHSSISSPYLCDVNSQGNLILDASGAPAHTTGPQAGPAAGIAFQQWSSGPHKINNNTAVGDTQIIITLTPNAGPTPVPGQRLIIPAYQLEADIASLGNNSASNLKVNLTNISGPATPSVTYPTNTLPVAIKGTDSSAGDVICFVTDRCSYTVGNTQLTWNWKGNNKILGNDITNASPFTTPLTPAGALYSRFVAAIDLSTSDLKYSNRGYKAANILLNGQVPYRTKLTTFQ